ncbi:MAG TPA: matrixin family metalloprotease [Polyangiaceae bacterium]|nr:matrixin family metalloprotease [Polyangiaceae bacterium]
MGLESWRRRVGLCRPGRWRHGWAPLALALLASVDAQAFCRTPTCLLDREKKVPCPIDPQTSCNSGGTLVYWEGDCLSYAIQRDGSSRLGITAEQVAPLVEESFRAWSDVTCADGETPAITALAQGSIACAEIEFNCREPELNSNLILFRDEFEDTDTFRFGVIALTIVTANTRTGRIYDADIEINSRDEEFVLGQPPPGSEARDLRGVLAHEIGHLLGLSHSNASGALMNPDYRGTVLPAQDDIAGICEIRPGASEDPQCEVAPLPPDAGCLGDDKSCKLAPPSSPPAREQEDGSGCACALPLAHREGAGGWPLALLWLGWLRRGRGGPEPRAPVPQSDSV